MIHRHCPWGDVLLPQNAEYLPLYTHVSTIIHVDAFRPGGPGIDTPVEFFGFPPQMVDGSPWTVRRQLWRARDTGKVSILQLGVYYGNGLTGMPPGTLESLIGFGPYHTGITEGGVRTAIDRAVRLDVDVLQLFNEHDFPSGSEHLFAEWVKYARTKCDQNGIKLLVEGNDPNELEAAAPYAHILGCHLFGKQGQWEVTLDHAADLAVDCQIPLWVTEMIPLADENYSDQLDFVEAVTADLNNGTAFVSGFLSLASQHPVAHQSYWGEHRFKPAYQILYAGGLTPGGRVFVDRYMPPGPGPIEPPPPTEPEDEVMTEEEALNLLALLKTSKSVEPSPKKVERGDARRSYRAARRARNEAIDQLEDALDE